jgi:hypothetical protein
MQILSVDEQKVFEQLENISHESLWADAIRLVVNARDPSRFRSLILQLQSQSRDNESVMRNILGDAFDSVMSLRIEPVTGTWAQ